MEIKRTGFSYAVSAVFTLTGEMYNRMAFCSDNHYDGKCKSANQPGGFLYGYSNRLWFENTGQDVHKPDVIPDEWKSEITISSSDLDLLCKICEVELQVRSYGKPQLKYEETLLYHLSPMMIELSAEWKRVNKDDKRPNS